MREIKLNSLRLENFMKFRDFTFEPKGRNSTIVGDNGVGKSTIASAFSWLLFDKDIHGNGTSNFSVKTRDDKDKIIPGIDHTVESVLEIDGTPLTLSKNYKEKWTKKRGESQKLLTGHVAEHEINGVPVKKKEYDAKIAGIIPEELFRLLTSVTYFNSIKWESRRSILFSLCEGLSEDALGEAEDKKKILASKKKKINEKIKQIPPRIDELSKTLAEATEYNQSEIQAKIVDLEKQIQTIKSDSTRTALLKERSELEAKLSQNEADQTKTKQEATNGIRDKIEKIEDDYAKTKRIINNMEHEIETQSGAISAGTMTIKDLRQEFNDVAINQDTGAEDICYACKQPVPQDQKDAALTAFNLNKSEKLEKINHLGKIAKGKKETAEAAKTKLEAEIMLERKDFFDIEKNLDKKKAELEELRQAVSPMPEQIKDIASRIADVEDLLGQKTQEQDIVTIESELKAEMTKIAEINAGEKAKVRIRELMEEEKDLSSEMEKLEGDLFWAEQAIQDQARTLEDEINGKFELVKFQLFETQINEGIRPTCITLIDGIPYGHGLNRGNEINAGLDIIRTLSNHYQIQCPVFIDDGSLISKPIDPGCQHFKLINAKDMKTLEIVVDK